MCGETCAQVALIAFNIVFVLSGYGVLAVGLFVRFQEMSLDEFIGSSLITSTTYILMVAGGVVMMVSMAGFIGAVRKSKNWLLVYSILLIVTFLMEATAGILGFICHDQVKDSLDEHVKPAILKKYGYKEYKLISNGVDYLQQEFECCGYEDSLDWSRSDYYTDQTPEVVAARGSSKLPVSCCIDINKAGCNNNFDSNIFTESCFKKLKSFIQTHLQLLGAVGVGVCLLQLVGLVLSVLLIKKTKEEELEF